VKSRFKTAIESAQVMDDTMRMIRFDA
jgi:hypothetical protein